MTLEDMTLDGSNDYVLFNNHGTTRLTGNTSITAKEGDVAFDVCYWSPAYADDVTVIVDTTGTITGKIEYSTYGPSTPENTVANSAQIIKNVNHVGTISAVAEGVNIATVSYTHLRLQVLLSYRFLREKQLLLRPLARPLDSTASTSWNL